MYLPCDIFLKKARKVLDFGYFGVKSALWPYKIQKNKIDNSNVWTYHKNCIFLKESQYFDPSKYIKLHGLINQRRNAQD